MHSYKYAILILSIWFSTACESKLREIYVKSRTAEELKINAFEICGRHYMVLSYEEDTAHIKCLKKPIKQ